MKDSKQAKKPITFNDFLLAAALAKMKARYPELAENTNGHKTGFGTFKKYLRDEEYCFDSQFLRDNKQLMMEEDYDS